MALLALETSTEACSVAVAAENGSTVSRFQMAPRDHTRRLPLQVNEVLDEAGIARTDLTAIAYSHGPGAFTGLRIASSFAQGLSLGLEIPLIGISTLEVLAVEAYRQCQQLDICVVMDARMNQVYTADFTINKDTGLPQIEGTERLVSVDDFQIREGRALSGTGMEVLINQIKKRDEIKTFPCFPNAESLLKLAKQKSNESHFSYDISLNYLRDQVAEKSRKNPLG